MIGQIEPDVEAFKNSGLPTTFLAVPGFFELVQPPILKDKNGWQSLYFCSSALEGETRAHEQSPIKLSFLPFTTGGLYRPQKSLFEPGH